jgi:hypothetical protein
LRKIRNIYIKIHIKSRRMGWAEHVTQMGRKGMHIASQKRPLRRNRLRWEDNIKMDLRDI